MTKRAEIVTTWAGDGTPQSPYHPKIRGDYPLLACHDETGQESVPPSPNGLIVLIECDDATLALIEADPGAAVLWSEDYAPE